MILFSVFASLSFGSPKVPCFFGDLSVDREIAASDSPDSVAFSFSLIVFDSSPLQKARSNAGCSLREYFPLL